MSNPKLFLAAALSLFALVGCSQRAMPQGETVAPAPATKPIAVPAKIKKLAVTTQPVALDIASGTLYGTLELPQTLAPPPVALILAGSGPTDRDGNSLALGGENRSLRLLAEGLAARGIASVRYDKRGVGESAKAGSKESDLRFDNYIDDAVSWGEKLKSDKRFSRLIVVGHSEGSLIGMVAAGKLNAAAFVSIAGPGQPAGRALLGQLKPKLPADLMKQSEAIIASLTEGVTVATTPKSLDSLFRPSVQPYLISWFAYDPAREITKLTMPILIVQGTTDLQVGVEDAKLLAKAKPSANLSLVEGMNHVFKEVSGGLEEQLDSYSDPALPVAPKLVAEVSQFINRLGK